MKKNIFLVGALALTLAACGNSAEKPAENAEAPAETAETTEKTATATAPGYGGDIKLTVTMEGDNLRIAQAVDKVTKTFDLKNKM